MSNDNADNTILLKLRDIRRAKGMSLHALADQVGIDYQRVGRMERGETQMTVDMLNKISKVLHVPITDLLSENNIARVEHTVVEQAPYNKTISLIPTIYEKLDLFCSKYDMHADPKVKVHLATVIFKAVEEMRTDLQDDRDWVKALFEVLDAIFERLIVSKDS
jgi:transcriptional regulator with XRE-family HTH domain